jgi:hypothetical protein
MTHAPDKAIPANRSGVGKSLMRATSGWGCEREAFYQETIRDHEGNRLRFPMPEKVHFGTAVDVAVAELLAVARDWYRDMAVSQPGGRVRDPALPPVPQPDWHGELDAAIELGYRRGVTDARWADPKGDEERSVFRLQLTTALEKFLGILPNNPKPDTEQPTGPPLLWLFTPQRPDGLAFLDAEPEAIVRAKAMRFQGIEGETLRMPDMVRGDELVGTPDIVLMRPDGVAFEWVDVKATGRAYSYPAKWLQAEAVLYDTLLTGLNGGEPPEWHSYLEYRRNAKPYWHLTRARVVASGSALLARALMARWEDALVVGSPDIVSFEPTMCGRCNWRAAIDSLGFPGCPIGEAVVSITGLPDDATL